MQAGDVAISKTLSYWLRHAPEAGGLTLDAAGWADVDQLMAALTRSKTPCDWDGLLRVVDGNDKQRFEFSADAARIRARQGHSVEVELDWPQTPPPEQLFHGTVDRVLDLIRAEGLRPMSRHHVHLSGDVETARRVGARRGAPRVLAIDAGAMAAAGHVFLLTANGVWLTDQVPPDFIRELET
jgi:putative RNA 2'-phosphotransferase